MKRQKPHTLLIYFSRAILLTLSVFILFISLFIAAIQWTGSTREIVSVADRFQPSNVWKLETERVEPPRLICIQDIPCPEVFKRWSTNAAVSAVDLNSTVKTVNLNLTLDDNCFKQNTMQGLNVPTCDATGIYDHYRVSVWISEDTDTSHKTLTLVVKESS